MDKMAKQKGTNQRIFELRMDFLSSQLYSQESSNDKVYRMLVRKADQLAKVMQGKAKLTNGKRAWTYEQRTALLADKCAEFNDYIQRSVNEHNLSQESVSALRGYVDSVFSTQVSNNKYLIGRKKLLVRKNISSALENKIVNFAPQIVETAEIISLGTGTGVTKVYTRGKSTPNYDSDAGLKVLEETPTKLDEHQPQPVLLLGYTPSRAQVRMDEIANRTIVEEPTEPILVTANHRDLIYKNTKLDELIRYMEIRNMPGVDALKAEYSVDLSNKGRVYEEINERERKIGFVDSLKVAYNSTMAAFRPLTQALTSFLF